MFISHHRPLVTNLPDSRGSRLAVVLFAIATGSLLLYPAPVAWLGLAALIAAVALRGRELGWTLGLSLFALPIGLYLAGALVGLLATVTGSHFAEVRFFGLLAAIASFYLLSHLATSGFAARRLTDGLLLATALATPLVLLLVAPFIQVWYLPQPIPEFVAWLSPVGAPIRETVLAVPVMGQRYRLYAAGLGALAVFGVGLALGPAVASSQRAARTLGWAAVAYFASFAAISANRGAALTVLILILLVGAVHCRWLTLVGLFSVISAAGLAVTQSELSKLWPNQFWQQTVSPQSVQQRLEFWANSVFLLGDFWFTGVGLGLRSVETVYRDYFLPVRPPFFHAHNVFIQSHLEQGLLGLLGLIGLVMAGAMTSWQTLRRTHEPMARSAAISASTGALALLVAGLTEIVAMTTVGMVLLFSVLGLLSGISRLDGRRATGTSASTLPVAGQQLERAGPLLVAAAATLLLAAVLPVALNASLRSTVPASLDEPVQMAVARVYLNLGALELAKATLSGSRRPLPAHLERADAWLERARNLDPSNPAISRSLASLALANASPAEALDWLGRAEQQARPDDRRLHFQFGRLYREAADVDRAIASWTRVGAHDQLLGWGNELLQQNRPGRAVGVYRAAIQTAPLHPGPYAQLRTAAQHDGGDNKALAELQRLAEKYAVVPWPYLEIAEIHAQAGRLADADAWYRLGAMVAPEDPRVRQRLPPS